MSKLSGVERLNAAQPRVRRPLLSLHESPMPTPSASPDNEHDGRPGRDHAVPPAQGSRPRARIRARQPSPPTDSGYERDLGGKIPRAQAGRPFSPSSDTMLEHQMPPPLGRSACASADVPRTTSPCSCSPRSVRRSCAVRTTSQRARTRRGPGRSSRSRGSRIGAHHACQPGARLRTA
jgi:hypothetical protein